MSKVRWIVFITALLTVCVSVGYIVFYLTEKNDRGKIYEELKETAILSTTHSYEEKMRERIREFRKTDDDLRAESEPYSSPVDFEALWKVNPDIYAWIDIPNTDVSYPIVCSSKGDEYYLNRTVEGRSGYPGSIFTYNVNAKDFTDFNTVIYGHNMKDASMFGSLYKYRNEVFFNEHRTIWIFTPDSMLVYRVFAAVIHNDKLITEAYNNNDSGDCRRFLDSIFRNRKLGSIIMNDVDVTPDDKIITLSTCIRGMYGNRYLVVAVKTNEYS